MAPANIGSGPLHPVESLKGWLNNGKVQKALFYGGKPKKEGTDCEPKGMGTGAGHVKGQSSDTVAAQVRQGTCGSGQGSFWPS